MNATAPTVFVVDDDPSVLRALERLLRSAGYVVEAHASPRAFLERAPSERPGCVLLDLRMPDLGGLELHEELERRGCPLPAVFLTGHGDVSSSVRAMKAGAVDFLTKPCDDTDLLAAVARAIERDALARAARDEQRALRTRFEALTPREREVCVRVARGLLNKEIADELGAAEKTIKVHRGRVMEKLGVESVAELVRLVDRLDGP
ncbi:LuxR family transcriptional regulator [Sorangium cellulosum]|uniref:LuxR family transcriptional regulator n=1 Tax=Sorangium cellulosum TaxID=56 RepID=A0A2L0EST9_SORCE|nr:response regulator [Sorangium cellulosum]AUX42359.1 LuxR family transcriptional regulator [Sorangium cellulosum]